jgi:hypothetical protein
LNPHVLADTGYSILYSWPADARRCWVGYRQTVKCWDFHCGIMLRWPSSSTPARRQGHASARPRRCAASTSRKRRSAANSSYLDALRLRNRRRVSAWWGMTPYGGNRDTCFSNVPLHSFLQFFSRGRARNTGAIACGREGRPRGGFHAALCRYPSKTFAVNFYRLLLVDEEAVRRQ